MSSRGRESRVSKSPLVVNAAFVELLQRRSGQPILACYQCRKCTAGCPSAAFMDIDPARIVHLAQLGQRDILLSCRAIWLCIGCETCGTRCPNAICVGRITDALKEMTLEADVLPGEPAIASFHRTYLNTIRRFGRVHEVSMLVEYKLRAGNVLADLDLGLKLLLARKLPLVPSRVRGRQEIEALFRWVQWANIHDAAGSDGQGVSS